MDLIIMVDNGIVVFEVMMYVKEIGLDVIVMDYYELWEVMLEVVVVIYLKYFKLVYFFDELVGVGVVYKLLYVLFGEELKELFDLVVVGMVVDLVFLIDENCLFV